MNRYSVPILITSLLFAGVAIAEDEIRAKLLANAGVLITHGETKIVFDPLFDQGFGTYDLVPDNIVQALFDGVPPFDGLDAVFVSHHHGDHFSPARMLHLLRARPELRLFAPAQAIKSMPLESDDAPLRKRLHSVDLELNEQFEKTLGDIVVEAVRIPHSGWPTRHSDVENIAFRVSLDGIATVVHLGDATTDDDYFENHAEYWAEQHSHLALPPYWFFLSEEGERVLDERIDADRNLGVHVPRNMPDEPGNYPPELRGKELLTVPGEERSIDIEASGEVE